MYIWVGCKLPEHFEQQIRSVCLGQNKALNLNTDAFSLPQHVSLKISFPSQRHEEILKYLEAFLSVQAPFSLRIRSAQQQGNILWLPVEENETLRQLHQQLDARLEQRFGIAQHPFDKCFLFHSTLFMDEDTDKLSQMRKALEAFPVEQVLQVDTFLLGLSENNLPGQYRIVRQINV
ncbi:MAG: 2'-5' RNA ligase family protein [Oscillospiraceae bacterium]|nr:2'-5' RNA ligase family protein [Oscillospiraceae bacterium]